MDGYRAYKYYASIKLHFTSRKYDVFKMKGRLNYSRDRFVQRNDRYLFEKLGARFTQDKDYVHYIASNFMYGHPNVIYDMQQGDVCYKEFIRRRQSITKLFQDDLSTIVSNGSYNFGGQGVPDVVQLWLSGKIMLETLVILDDMDGWIDRVMLNDHICLILGDDLLRLKKSKGFVKYDSVKVMNPYITFLEDIKEETHG